MFRASDAFLIPFSLLWGGFACVWESMAVAGGAPFFFVLWGTPFVLLGLYLVAGRFIVDARQRQRIYYAVTNERALIISGLSNRNVKSLSLRTLPEINISIKGDGRGTISFGSSNQPLAWLYSGGGWPGMGRHAAPAFEMIDNAREVYRLIQQAQRA
jgi:hypothetical protein